MKKQLNLKSLKVKSFVTEINSSDKQTVQGGLKKPTNDGVCNQATLTPTCQTGCFYCPGPTTDR